MPLQVCQDRNAAPFLSRLLGYYTIKAGSSKIYIF